MTAVETVAAARVVGEEVMEVRVALRAVGDVTVAVWAAAMVEGSWRGGVLFFPKSGVVFSHTHSCAFLCIRYASMCIYVHFVVFLSILSCCILQIGYIITHFRTTLSCWVLHSSDVRRLHFDAFYNLLHSLQLT